ncbi:MAG: 1-acyl-sn-glycerol-3-phosphate acyltransferase [Sandaracinaceae bacterium]|nr:1-acyl-sn-glycerol-3-phosphate acyltransferase [Sandaracinaceae bacterium]
MSWIGEQLYRWWTTPWRIPQIFQRKLQEGEPLIFGLNQEREKVIREVVARVEKKYDEEKLPIEYLLNETAFDEIQRLEQQQDEEARVMLAFWKGITRRLGKMGDGEIRRLLHQIIYKMAEDIAGNFDPRVYRVATHLVPHLLSVVMDPSDWIKDWNRGGGRKAIVDRLIDVEGPLDLIRSVAQVATLIIVPTHSSNLDSIVVGYALMREGLPPVAYGAGKNLFTNPLIAFFMHNLGAYRVDRRVRARVYKDTLKNYSTVLIEWGYHSLFFPGGTRSRSGMVESKLKLGLMGTAIEAFSRNCIKGVHRPIVFIPATINYGLVLEAESLIDQWLREKGRARYIPQADEFSQIERWIALFEKAFEAEVRCVLRFAHPIDPFGNPVDERGKSQDRSGRTIDPCTYAWHRGSPCLDQRRDEAYTKFLGEVLVRNYQRETVIMPTHLVAHILFRRLVRETPGADVFGRVRLRGEVKMPRNEVEKEVGQAIEKLRELEENSQVRLFSSMRALHPSKVVDIALRAFVGYHTRPVVVERAGEVVIEDPPLCLYYQNRMNAYAEKVAGPEDIRAAREIASMV